MRPSITRNVLAGLMQLAALATAATTDQWRTRTIYFAIPDRIARSSDDSGGAACGNLNTYCGGTFAGLEGKLDYIQGMGFDAIWITPVVANHENGFHGYWAQDLNTINPYLGSADDLKSLINTAHSKGIYIMADVVANHMGTDYSQNDPSPLNDTGSYHPECTIDYNNQTSVENCWVADDCADLDTTDPNIRQIYQTWVHWLITEFGFDGVRIDTVKHVEKDYWPPFCEAAGVYSLGEVFNGDPNYVSGYASLMSGLLNYPIYYPLGRFYQQTGSSQDLVDMHNQISSVFPDPGALGTFADNHDNDRWLHTNGDVALFKNALAYVLLTRGVPIVYYGSEQGYAGSADNNGNREDLWHSGFNTDADLYQAIARLTAAKKNAGGLGSDDQVHLYVEDTAYAWSREGGRLIVLTVNSGSGYSGQQCFNSQVNYGAWDDVFGQGSYTSDGSGNICVQVTGGLPVVLLSSQGS